MSLNVQVVHAVRVTHARDPPGQRCVYILPGEKEREVYRITTYKVFPQHVPVDVLLLASLGFLYTGFKDRVKCFVCGQCVEGLTGNEDMSLPSWHKSDCEFANGTDTTNIPLQSISRSPPQTRAQRPREASLSAGEVLNNATVNRDTGMVVLPNNLSVHQTATIHQPVLPQTATIQQPPPEVMETPPETREAGIPNTLLFPCNEPFNPHMRNESSRLQTFTDNLESWSEQIVLATPRQIANAGLFYIGNRDRVKCWYCNGGLQNWERDDDPWFEHAKWFPHCEFVLQQKGPEYVHNIVSQFPNLRRPTMPNRNRHLHDISPIGQSQSNVRPPVNESPQIIDPRAELRQLKEKVDSLMTSSPIVPEAIMMGFEEETIRLAIRGTLEAKNTMFTTVETLVDALLNLESTPEDVDEENIPMETAPVTTNAPESSTSELKRLEESRMCKSCHEELASVVVLPCGHLVLCTKCGSGDIKKCPLCKSKIRESIRTYMA